MRKYFVLSYARRHQFNSDYLQLTLFLGHLLHELAGCHHHAISLDVKDKTREGHLRASLNGILTRSLMIFCDDGICYFTQRTSTLKKRALNAVQQTACQDALLLWATVPFQRSSKACSNGGKNFLGGEVLQEKHTKITQRKRTWTLTLSGKYLYR